MLVSEKQERGLLKWNTAWMLDASAVRLEGPSRLQITQAAVLVDFIT